MRALIPVLLVAAHLSAQSAQVPVFRSGVEVMEVDVTVVDGQGRPIRDLRAPEFTVTIDGQPRKVISAEFISESTGPSKAAEPVRDPYVSNNTDRNPGRLIMLVIDRNNIDTHTVRQSVAPMKNFVSSLGPDDRLALATIPPPGPMVDFTTNHAQILDAIESLGRTSRCHRDSTSAISRRSRSTPDRIRLRFSVCCTACAAIPIRRPCRTAIATSSRRR
jgi:VWFA-related protein